VTWPLPVGHRDGSGWTLFRGPQQSREAVKKVTAFIASLALALNLAGAALAHSGPPGPDELTAAVAGLSRPTAIYVAGRGTPEPWGAASGVAYPATGAPMTVDTPLRIASNAKTFTAATVLRLWETGRIDLDAPIGPLLTPSLDALLKADGYDTAAITVRHLLSHSAGLYDHGGDRRFVEAVMADPAHFWSRDELVGLSMAWADPQPPGEAFRYSDTGYVLLGDIVERITGKSLGVAVRQELRLDRLGLTSSWWEIMEPAPAGVVRAPQGLGRIDAAGWHASMDLYGGGGMVMSARDLAVFFAALFEGRIFDKPDTLDMMLWQGPHERGDHYRFGIFVSQIDGRTFYWHSGFWGTIALYSPDTGVAVAGMTNNQDGFLAMRTLAESIIGAPPSQP
jgi:D-alanyl-D-alanine carboxypeptidase